MRYPLQELTGRIIGCFYTVYNQLGYGFLERVYERAMLIELEKSKIMALRQQPIEVRYSGRPVGTYFADLVVEDKVIVEIKASESLAEEHEHQLLNYLRATDKEIGLLFNFGKSPEIRRLIFTNDRKPHLPSSSV